LFIAAHICDFHGAVAISSKSCGVVATVSSGLELAIGETTAVAIAVLTGFNDAITTHRGHGGETLGGGVIPNVIVARTINPVVDVPTHVSGIEFVRI
jgi:hypothetical protein